MGRFSPTSCCAHSGPLWLFRYCQRVRDKHGQSALRGTGYCHGNIKAGFNLRRLLCQQSNMRV